MAKTSETKHELSYLKSKVELASSSAITALAERTTFVFAPNSTPPQPSNVFTSWTSLLAAVALTRGPITIQLDPAPTVGGTITIPGGTLSGHDDIWFVGAPSSVAGQFTTPVTLTAPFVTTGISLWRFSLLEITYTGAAAPAIALPPTATGGVANIVLDYGTRVQQSGGQAFIKTNAAASGAIVRLFDDSSLLGNAKVLESVDAASSIRVELYGASSVLQNTIAATTGLSLPFVNSTAALYSTTQINAPSNIINATYSYPSAADALFTKFAFVDGGANGVQCAAQVAPAGDMAFCAIVIPRSTGKFMVSASLSFDGSATPGTYTVETVSKQKAAAMVVANGTAVGSKSPATNQGGFFATADGAITIGGGTTDLTHNRATFNVPAGIASSTYSWSGIVAPTGGGGFAINQNVAVGISLTSANNFVGQNAVGGGPAATLSVYEIDAP